jgi:hypothetical protein
VAVLIGCGGGSEIAAYASVGGMFSSRWSEHPQMRTKPRPHAHSRSISMSDQGWAFDNFDVALRQLMASQPPLPAVARVW